MPIYVEPLLSTAPTGVTDVGVVRAGIPEMDDCKILTRLKAFIVDQGVQSTLEHTFRGRDGNPKDLSEWLSAGTSQTGSFSSSSSASASPSSVVRLRVREWLGEQVGAACAPIYEVTGESIDPVGGIIRAQLNGQMVEKSGIYDMTWAVVNEAGVPVAVDRGIMSVERSMFPMDLNVAYENLGPPTLQEVRMRLMDSSRNENILLDDIEFKDEQILQAMWEPVRIWNETPPPIKRFSTASFPFRGAWIQGVLAQLYFTASNHYRRNLLRQAAGGGSDKDKEKEYMTEGKRLWDEYMAWLYNKKVEINMKTFFSDIPSAYSSRSGW